MFRGCGAEKVYNHFHHFEFLVASSSHSLTDSREMSHLYCGRRCKFPSKKRQKIN